MIPNIKLYYFLVRESSTQGLHIFNTSPSPSTPTSHPPLHPTGHHGCRCIEARSVINVILTTVSPNRVMYGESQPRQFAGSLRGSFVKGSSLLG